MHATLADIAAAGSPVRYLAADVSDADSLGAALRAVRAEWGPITGVVHGAGVLADRLVADKTDEQFELVMRVKATGFRNLLELVGADNADDNAAGADDSDNAADGPALVCVFSSVVVSAGNAGQCDYAAANEIVERMALDWRARHPDCLVKAIAWGPWQGGMVGPELAAAFGERNIPLIPPAEGAAAFVEELAGPADQVRCLITAGGGDLPASGSGGDRVSRGGEIEVSEVAQAWLADHRVGGRAVVPLAVAFDWMLRLADEPDTGPVVLRDIDVVHGIAAPAVVTVRRNGIRAHRRDRRRTAVLPGVARRGSRGSRGEPGPGSNHSGRAGHPGESADRSCAIRSTTARPCFTGRVSVSCDGSRASARPARWGRWSARARWDGRTNRGAPIRARSTVRSSSPWSGRGSRSAARHCRCTCGRRVSGRPGSNRDGCGASCAR